MVIRIIEMSGYLIVEIPYIIGLMIQIYFVLTRPKAVKKDYQAKTILVVILTLVLPLSYFNLTEINPSYEFLTLILGGFSSMLFLWSAIRLGRSFAVIPAVRICIFSGPYSYIRHPIYSSYLIFDLGFILATPNKIWVIVWFLELFLFYWRASNEERLLLKSDKLYQEYIKSVPKMFIPFVF